VLAELQSRVQVIMAGVDYWPVYKICTRLCEEAGEVCSAVAKGNHEQIRNESGDVIFTLTCMANKLDLDLDAGLDAAIDKAYRMNQKLIAAGTNVLHMPDVNAIYRHFKNPNRFYVVTGFPWNADEEETMVEYRPLEGLDSEKRFVRTLTSFFQHLPYHGKVVTRFTKVDPTELKQS
jgi:NTP pyrophosphatase (non-canonical NTP hydrolase)